eukprot:1143894-Pelagomonas_calceolata.AAC.8
MEVCFSPPAQNGCVRMQLAATINNLTQGYPHVVMQVPREVFPAWATGAMDWHARVNSDHLVGESLHRSINILVLAYLLTPLALKRTLEMSYTSVHHQHQRLRAYLHLLP